MISCAYRWTTAFAAVACLLGVHKLVAQTGEATQDEKVVTLHAYANLVQIPTLALGQDLKPILSIVPSRFFVSIDGGPKVHVLDARREGDDPIALSILIDVTQPNAYLMDKIDDAIADMAPGFLSTRDRVSVFGLDCQLVRTADDIPAETATLKKAVASLLGPWKARGEVGDRKCMRRQYLWDSVALVTKDLGTRPGRRVMLIISDGIDHGSSTPWSLVKEHAAHSGVAIFDMVVDPDAKFSLPRKGPLDALCGLTGGLVLMPDKRTLGGRLDDFTTLLRGRYIVEFPPPKDSEGESHSMDVTIDGAVALIRSAGVEVPVDVPNISGDPNTVPSDSSHTPHVGSRKVQTPN